VRVNVPTLSEGYITFECSFPQLLISRFSNSSMSLPTLDRHGGPDKLKRIPKERKVLTFSTKNGNLTVTRNFIYVHVKLTYELHLVAKIFHETNRGNFIETVNTSAEIKVTIK
jgi:hypothetical protein